MRILVTRTALFLRHVVGLFGLEMVQSFNVRLRPTLRSLFLGEGDMLNPELQPQFKFGDSASDIRDLAKPPRNSVENEVCRLCWNHSPRTQSCPHSPLAETQEVKQKPSPQTRTLRGRGSSKGKFGHGKEYLSHSPRSYYLQYFGGLR